MFYQMITIITNDNEEVGNFIRFGTLFWTHSSGWKVVKFSGCPTRALKSIGLNKLALGTKGNVDCTQCEV